MRPVLRAVATIALLVIIALPSISTAAAAVGPAAAPRPGPGSAPAHDAPAHKGPAAPIPPSWGLNTTLAPALLARPSTAPPPISAISPVPLPPIPTTHPTVVTLLANSTSCCIETNVTAPSGSWALVVLNYTGEAVAGVYDSSFRAYIDQAEVFFGTTPEYGIWYDDADVTPYDSLLTGTFNFTFLLGAAVTTGYFLTSVSLWFYPVPSGGVAPTEPNLVIPLWHRVTVTSTSTVVADEATVPTNVTNATLQLWVYGFGADEFWYAEQPALRTIEVSIDNTTVLDFLPFQFINTGGNDLFAWRPITGAFTLSNRPYDIDVTGLLASLEGTHDLTATITGVTSGSDWLLGGSLLLSTRTGAPAATAPSAGFTGGTPHIESGVHSYAEFVNDTSSSQSTWGSGASATTVAEFTNTSYQNVFATPSGWENISAWERMTQTVVTASNGTSSVTETAWSFPFSADLGSQFVANPGQSGGYPIYGNVTDYMLSLQQEWNETEQTWSGAGAAQNLVATATVDDRVTGGQNLFIGTEELISANAAELTAVTFVQSATTADYRASRASGALAWNFEHVLIGSGYDLPPPNEVEPVLVNQVVDPVAAGLTVSAPAVDVGGTVTLDAAAVGGAGNYQYAYWGLPTGCATADTAALTCRPSETGTFSIWVVATDGSGSPSPAASVGLLVAGSPSVRVLGNGSRLDAGVNGQFTPEITGGVAPYVCTWGVPGAPIVVNTCTSGDAASGGVPGTTVPASVSVQDATGVVVSTNFSFTVVPPPQVAWVGSVPSNATAPAALELRSVASDGVGPYTFVWLVNGTAVQNSTDANFTLVAVGGGTYTVLLELTDSDGAQAVAGPISISVSGPPTSPPGGGGGGSTSSGNALEWAVLAGVGAGAAGLVLGVLIGRSRRPTPPGG
jgi:hypothetical protein